MNIPNILTALRFAIIPVFAVFLLREHYVLAVILFVLAGVTDVLDGYVARKFDLITSWGKLADPLADKLIQLTALLILTVQGKIPWVVVFIVIAKELLMGLGSILLYRKKFVVTANWYGKLATVIFYFAIIMIIFNGPYSDVFVVVAVAATLFAFYMYIMSYREINAGLKKEQTE